MNSLLPGPERAIRLNRNQGRLLNLAAVFLLIYTLALMVSPAARFRIWDVDYRWEPWLGYAAWLGLYTMAHRETSRWLPDRDPTLLPLAGLISGWGLLTIWRVTPTFGLRQTFWLLIVMALLFAGLRLPSDLGFLRRYKYLWLSGGILLTALTLFLGTNPSGGGPRLWLGCCGFYLQPSEPLKLLLIIYLAAYLADRQFLIPHLLPLLAPTIMMISLALLLLVFQRDLGTATIFLVLYTMVIFVATGRRRLLALLAGALSLAGIAGYILFDVVRIRIEAWANPWLDPSGRSYQIVQSLLAVAAGGIPGRGPGLGSPTLVPVQHSDFIFAAIAEETGLIGSLALMLLIAVLTGRGLRIAIQSEDNFRRYLAMGLTTYLAAQSVLIIGGNLRLLPLTGVTLPFVSYGGSSLLTASLALLFLLHISNQRDVEPAPLSDARPYFMTGGFLYAGLLAVALATGWWAFYRGPALVARTDNARRVIADRFVHRGALVDRSESPLNLTSGALGELTRDYHYPPLSAILGYNHPVYGQAGLERSLDDYLRGLNGQPPLRIWWDHLLYGQSPPGLDVRLSLDLNLQRTADRLLGENQGALILLKARSGEILVMGSHPYFDPNDLDQTWETLTGDPRAPLLDRVTLGSYPPGTALGPHLLAWTMDQGQLPELPAKLDITVAGERWACAVEPVKPTWEAALASGCPAAVAVLGEEAGGPGLLALFQKLGLFTPPRLRLPTDAPEAPTEITNPGSAALGEPGLRISPLQMALAAAPLSAAGVRPAARLAMAVDTPNQGWVVLPALSQAEQALPPAASNQAAEQLTSQSLPVWQTLSVTPAGDSGQASWYVSGTRPDWEGTPLILVLVLEQANPTLAQSIGEGMWQVALQP